MLPHKMTMKLVHFLLLMMLAGTIGCAHSSKDQATDPIPVVTAGEIIRLENFESEYIPPRHVDIWLPNGYPDAAPYAVLYMNDGQMLYDPATTWNGQAWEVDDIGTDLISRAEVRPFIVVGIWNGGPLRHSEYFPQQPFQLLSESDKSYVHTVLTDHGRTDSKDTFQPASDNYLKFLVEELKPYIDRRFATSPDRNDTFIMGSSMGGLISMYAITQYPDIFGGAACISTHWPGIFDVDGNPVPEAFFAYLEESLPGIRDNNRIYFDYGDQTLDAIYPPLQQHVDGIMRRLGFDDTNWLTYFDQGAAHTEEAWQNRLHIPLRFLLGTVQ
jgi:pimeloyl-ACP methyl ester carboxylesterase